MAGALGLALAGPRVYGGVLVDDATAWATAGREANAADIRAALALYRARLRDPCVALVALLAACSSRVRG